ncbi:MurR/RpiR family transcriptional regulator [Halomonas binhaiensis]|uniref:MurR/RpiR family transcriptional regulator n=1 Tax=Halomonas binhaiensis TaxID=2562282 RepID=A0A856QJP3_9GAMM|nr:MurR/RpiR family transcriptional regulator [Halomonas binhaiensis]QEM80133.2 MurR/RpiR family transcriptional regulator [Halomonas binhaiensis]
MSKSHWSTTADQQFADSPVGQQVLHLLQQGSRSQRQLSGHILRDPVYAATHGIEDLAASTGISASTISRYVKDLGFSGFADFRAHLADAVHALIGPVSKIGEHFESADTGGSTTAESLAAAVEQLQALRDPGFATAVAEVRQHIAEARQVWVMGFGLSAHLAAMLAMGLQPYRDAVNTVVDMGGSEVAAARLANIGADDLVIAITFPRYSADLARLAEYAGQRSARVVGITDSRAAPISVHCDHLLLASAGHPVLSASCLPGLAVIEALVSDYILSDPANVERSARLATVMAHYLSAPR